MIFKVVFGLAFVFVSYLIGKNLTERKKFIKNFFETLKAFNVELSADVGLYCTPLKEKLFELNEKTDKAIDGFEKIFGGETFFCNDQRLNGEQRKFVSDYVNSLGKFDEKGQIKYQDKTDIIIDGFLTKSNEVFSKYSALSSRLAFCLGLTVFIIIV